MSTPTPTSDEGILLANLEARGKEFLTLFADLGSTQRAKDDESHQAALDFSGSISSFDDESDEWTGFASDHDQDMDFAEPTETGLDGARRYSSTFATGIIF